MNVKGLIGQAIWRMIQWPLFNSVRPRIIHTTPFLLRGKTRSNSNLTILVLANFENMAHYTSKLAYSEEPQISILEKTTYSKIPSIIAQNKPDLVIAEFDDSFSKFFSKNDFIILPRINFSLDILPSLEVIYDRMMRIRKRSIKKIENAQYTYEITKSFDKFKFFYDEIYIPFTSKTAKTDFARMTPMSTAKEWFLNGELLLVKRNGEYLSGFVYHPEGDALHCRLIAYTEGLAGQAAFYHAIKNAKEKGYIEVNYGETSPFLNDGLFFYKKSWGMQMRPKIKDYMILAIKLCNFETPVQDFLIDNPFVFTDFNSLIALVLMKSENKDIQSIFRKYYTPGLHKLMALYPEKARDQYKTLAPYNCVPPPLSALNTLSELTTRMGFDTYTLNFSRVDSIVTEN